MTEFNEPSFDAESSKPDGINLIHLFIDERLPPIDVIGGLADRQIRRHQLRAIAGHVTANWPRVSSVRCCFSDGMPFFSIHIQPFSEAAQRRHWPVADWIEALLEGEKCRFLFLPKSDKPSHPGDIEILSVDVNREMDDWKHRAA